VDSALGTFHFDKQPEILCMGCDCDQRKLF